MGLLLAWIRRCSFNEAYDRLEGLRAIDRAGVLNRKGGNDMHAVGACGQVSVPPPALPRYPVSFIITSTKSGAQWHIERGNAPWCRWRQKNAAYRGDVHRARSVQEALVYDREFCITCKSVLPGNDWVHLYQ